jgi:hypothetical protein
VSHEKNSGRLKNVVLVVVASMTGSLGSLTLGEVLEDQEEDVRTAGVGDPAAGIPSGAELGDVGADVPGAEVAPVEVAAGDVAGIGVNAGALIALFDVGELGRGVGTLVPVA